jgi:predicted TIM-barrel fold metal-dependent hydrolase
VAETIADWQATPGAVAIRIMMRGDVSADPADPGINHVLATAAKRDLPVNLLCWGRLDQVHELARRNPDTRLVIDHLGLQQPFEPPRMDNGFDELPKLLALAAFPNIVVKISGACTLSRGEYPYADIWEPLARIFDAFGMQRCLWGTDWTRAVELMTYAEGVDAFLKSDRLSDSDRAMLMGEATARTYRWAPGGK